ncbi:MAG: type I-B CRISPR-associated protein Cas7/Cst2/DevR [Thermomicrobium sp.]|nr:type I-B CRISPR-associated protein Cas7/Cst2/DevR [Thermomicrobium sp.]MDW8006822.1 type I-B CRISPR-associated protein Cas7/Cst2/DevR [Thermomicrobium sp.]
MSEQAAFPIVTGAVLIEANGAALNNAGQDEGRRTDNTIAVKQVQIGRLRYPYVSGQAWRRWWREVLYSDFGWKPSPVTRETKSAYTVGDPVEYEEDDVFGYMAARKRDRGGGTDTYRRVSPLRASLLISVFPNVIVDDFGHFSRNLPSGSDIIPFESQLYSTYLQGVFSLALHEVGRFAVGSMADVAEDTVKARDGVERASRDSIGREIYQLPRRERVRRVQDALRALARLRGGARLARNLSDVTPVAVVVGFVDGGNAPFQNLFSSDPLANEQVIFNLERFGSVLQDFSDRLLPVNGNRPVLVGFRPTVIANEGDVRRVIGAGEKPFDVVELLDSPGAALERAAALVESAFAFVA